MKPRGSFNPSSESRNVIPDLAGYSDRETAVCIADLRGVRRLESDLRLATAADEILPFKDPRVQSNEAYVVIILLARVVTRLGSVAAAYALEHLGGQRHAYTWDEFRTRYEAHFGTLALPA